MQHTVHAAQPGGHSLEALVFDFDGTIAETERDGHRVAYNAAFESLGLDWRWDETCYAKLLAVGGGKERIAHYIERYRSDTEAIADRSALISALHERKQQVFETLVGGLAFRPGVRRLVHEARAAGVRLAVATTAARTGVDALLARDRDFAAAFDVIAAGDVVPRKKPAPDIYHYALAELGVAAGTCVAVEDAAIGLAASRAAGILTLVTPSDYTRGEDFDGAAAIVSDLGEPDAPMTSIAGPASVSGFVDLAYLRSLLRQGCR